MNDARIGDSGFKATRRIESNRAARLSAKLKSWTPSSRHLLRGDDRRLLHLPVFLGYGQSP